MKNLLIKELRLSLQAQAVVFLALSALVMIPNYPYYVTFFYTSLGIFFCCQLGRENHDVFFTVCLPVRKQDVVGARMLLAVLLQLAQAALAVPFAALRQSFTALGGNQVGMDANIALFGLAFLMMGLFNYVFFTGYYRNVNRVGAPFVKSSLVMFVYMLAAEACAHTVPFFRDKLDTPDSLYVPEKLVVLGVGLALYALLTLAAYKRAARSFAELDL